MKVLLKVQYQGSPFHGWQFQPELTTVQGELEKALHIFISSESKRQLGKETAQPIQTTGSGRTDSGVRAEQQAVSFSWPDQLEFNSQRLVRALNGITVREISVLSAEVVGNDFDARITPHIKTYCYTFVLGKQNFPLYGATGWCVTENLNIPEMIKAARYIAGQHDFSAFRAQDCTATTTIRTILSSELTRADSVRLVYTVQGKGFLKQMIRIIAGTLVDVGRGKHEADYILELLKSGNRSLAGQTAPAHGLLLKSVKYPG